MEVVVVDNGAAGRMAIAADLPSVRVLTSGTNLGYAGGANLGVAATQAPVVAVCNPDLVVRPGTAAAMLGAPRCGA